MTSRRHRRLHRFTGNVSTSMLWSLLFAVCLAGAGIHIWNTLETRAAIGRGLIQLSDITLKHDPGTLHLQADARVRLPPTVQAGLDNGVPLTFVLNLTLSQQLRFRPDSTVFNGQRHYTLTYYELTRHYRVSELETDESRNFRSLSAALAGLGQLGRIEFALDEQQEAHLASHALTASLDMKLSKSALPLPLQPIIRSSWKVLSQEYRWPVI